MSTWAITVSRTTWVIRPGNLFRIECAATIVRSPESAESASSWASLATASQSTVAARLGHADPAVTLRAYPHVLREHALRVGDVFAQAIDKAIKPPVGKSVSKSAKQRRRRRLRWSKWSR